MKTLIKIMNNQTVRYVIVGGITTAVNYITYVITRCLHIDMSICNIIAWVLSVLFAFFANRKYVFDCKKVGFVEELKEIISFAIGRVATLGVEILLMKWLVEKQGYNEYIIKIAVNVLIIIFNYFISKLWVFRKSGKQAD